jgi:hypothetical protein
MPLINQSITPCTESCISVQNTYTQSSQLHPKSCKQLGAGDEVCCKTYCEVSCSGPRCPWPKLIYMKWWAHWLADNPRDHARCSGLTNPDRFPNRDALRVHERRWENFLALTMIISWIHMCGVEVLSRVGGWDEDVEQEEEVTFKRYAQDESCVFVVYHSREPIWGCSYQTTYMWKQR